jgi:periplasmic protein TonB
MTAATAGPSGTNGFSLFSGEGYGLYRTRQEILWLSMLGQAAVVCLLVYFISCVAPGSPGVDGIRPLIKELPLVFSGHGGGGGGNFEKTPASHGALPRASLAAQLAPPDVIVPKEMPRLPVEQTVMVAPEVPLPHGGQLGDPMSQISSVLSNGPGGPGGIGPGCCGGVGPSEGPGFGPGPRGVHPGMAGVTVPRLIYNPEPTFSDEARKSKTQGSVTLILVVGADGHTYDSHVQSSLGMGLDERAIEAVRRWRFEPARFNGQPVATQIAVEVNFHLY